MPDWATSTAPDATAEAKRLDRDPGPFSKQFRHRETGKVAIDLIGTGRQAVVPPSRHPSGEAREWEPGNGIGSAAVISFTELWDAVCRLADAAGAKVPDVKTEDKPQPEQRAKAEPRRAEGEREGRNHTTSQQTDWAALRTDLPPMDERRTRCRAYLETVDLARSGEGGHNVTFRVARIVVNDFAVIDRDAALGLLREYNRTLEMAGGETWSEGELEHKIDDAFAAFPDPAYPFGCKLQPPRAWNDPARLADEFLAARSVRFVKDTAFVFDGRAYKVVGHDWLAGEVRGFIEGRAAAEFGRADREHRERADRHREQVVALSGGGLDGGTDRAARAALDAEERRLAKARPKAVAAVTQPMVLNTLAAIRTRAHLPDDATLDQWLGNTGGPAVLCVANGLLDLTNRDLRLHSPAWFSTVALPVEYRPDAPPPERWLRFLDEVMEGDGDRVAVLQEVFGACLDRGFQGKFFAALTGRGDNGKSVFLAVLRAVLGDRNCSAVGLEELATNRFASFGLFGKLANVVGDQGYMKSHDEGRLKTLTGGDLVTFEQKGRDTFQAVNRAKIVFACNALPKFGDKSEAIWNRLVVVPFGYTVPADCKNPALLTADYWADELPGILNWAVAGLARLRANGGRFTRSATCDALKEKHRQDSDPARRFLLEHVTHTGNEDDRLPSAHLYAAYRHWAKDRGYDNLFVDTRFGEEVSNVFTGVRSKNCRLGGKQTRCWIGLQFADEPTAPGLFPAEGRLQAA